MIYKKNDFLRILFCIVTVVIVTAFFYIGSAENNAPDSSYAISSDAFTISSSSFSGSGSEEDPYLISASSQLVELSELVNGLKCRDDGRPYSACSYKLSADIDMSGMSFSPIGNYTDITFYFIDPENPSKKHILLSKEKLNLIDFKTIPQGGTIDDSTTHSGSINKILEIR